MRKIIRSIGHGLLAAGILLIVIYLAGAFLRGPDAFHDVLNPLTLSNYLVFAPLAPGAFLLWLSDLVAARRRYGNRLR